MNREELIELAKQRGIRAPHLKSDEYLLNVLNIVPAGSYIETVTVDTETASIEDTSKPTQQPQPRKSTTTISANGSIEQAIIDIVRSVETKVNIDIEQIEKLIDKKLENFSVPRELSISVNNASAVNVGNAHKDINKLITLVSLRKNIWLYGESGSGKTHICEQIAKALGMEFFAQSFCSQSTKTDMLGFTNVNGIYVETGIVRLYTNGGLVCLDEIDNANPNVLNVLNAMLSNGYCNINGQMVKRHPDCVVIACANTIGSGASRQYIGRNAIDLATRNRFCFFNLEFDPDLCCALCGVSKSDRTFKKLIEIREKIADIKCTNIALTQRGIKEFYTLNNDFTPIECLEMVCFQGETVPESILSIARSI